MSRGFYRYTKLNADDWVTIIYTILFIGCLALCCIRPINKATNQREVTVTVTDKAVKNSGDTGKYLVFTEDVNDNIEVFEITDSLFAGRWDSSDVYAAIKVGKTYKFTIGGSRNRILSWYPNIYDYKLIE